MCGIMYTLHYISQHKNQKEVFLPVVKRILLTLLITETVILAIIIFTRWTSNVQTELVREYSPNGDYTLLVERTGMWPCPRDHVTVTIVENIESQFYHASFSAEVANDGVPARFKIEWLDDGAKITLSGKEQADAVYILPFETSDE